MIDQNPKQPGKTLWDIADPLRGAMHADELRGLKPHHRGLIPRLHPSSEEVQA